MSETVTVRSHRDEQFTENRVDIVTPRRIPTDFGEGVQVPASRGLALMIAANRATRSDGVQSDFATVTIQAPCACCAVFVPQSADQLRDLAASCLRTADDLDGGSGKQ